jgi:hypothetical protein
MILGVFGWIVTGAGGRIVCYSLAQQRAETGLQPSEVVRLSRWLLRQPPFATLSGGPLLLILAVGMACAQHSGGLATD